MENSHIGRLFAKYVTLNIIGMIGLSCYILADTFFVARGLGANGLTALNLAIPVFSFIHGCGLMLGMGGATRFTLSKTKTIYAQAVWFAAALAVVFISIGIFGAEALAALLSLIHI